MIPNKNIQAYQRANEHIMMDLNLWLAFIPEQHHQKLKDRVHLEKLKLVDKKAITDIENRLIVLRRHGLKVLDHEQWLNRYRNDPKEVIRALVKQQKQASSFYPLFKIAPLVVAYIVRHHYVVNRLWRDVVGYETYLDNNACNFGKVLYNVQDKSSKS